MKKIHTRLGIALIFIISVMLVLSSNTAFAESSSDFIFSSQSNSTWVLKKSTRKLIFLQFQKPETTWKSSSVTIESDFNLNECILTSVGSRGTSVFLHDKSSGLITFFDAKKDHTIVSYVVVNINEDLK